MLPFAKAYKTSSSDFHNLRNFFPYMGQLFYLKYILPGTRHSKKTNRTSFCTLFLKLPLQFFLFRRKTNFSTALFQKRGTKTVWNFFLQNCLCHVPGKISLIIVCHQFPHINFFSIFSTPRNYIISSNFMFSFSSLHIFPPTQPALYICYLL